MAIREVAAKLGVEIDDGPIAGFVGKLDGAKAAMMGFGAALGFQKLASWISSTADAAFQLETLSVKTGASVKEIQKLGYMLQLSGSNAAAAESILFDLNQQLTNASGTGGYFAESLRKLGIATKDAAGKNRGMTDILPEVAAAMDKAGTEAQKTQIALRVFGQSGLEAMRPLLKKGAAGVRELSREFEDLNLGVSKEAVEANSKVSKEFQRFGLASKSIAGTILGALAPSIATVIRLAVTAQSKFLEWTKKTNVLTTAFAGLKVALLAYAVVQARQMLPGLVQAVRAFMALRTSILGASVPLFAVIAVIAALYLVFDDLFTLMTGGDSLIGSLLDKFGGVGAKANMVKTLNAAWETMQATWVGIQPALKSLWALLAEGSTSIGPSLSKAFIGVVKSIVAVISALSTLAGATVKLLNKDYSGAAEMMHKGKDAIFGKRNSYWDPKTGQMVSEDVGGIFGKTEGEYKSQMDTAYGKPPPPPVVNTPVNVKIDATNMQPADALNAVKTGVGKGVSTAVEDSYGAVATFAPGGVK